MPRKPCLSLVGEKAKLSEKITNLGEKAFSQSPDLHNKNMHISRPFVEMELAFLLAEQLSDSDERANTVFQVVRRSTTQQDVVLDSGCPSRKDQDFLKAVMKMVKSVETELSGLDPGHLGTSIYCRMISFGKIQLTMLLTEQA